MLTFILVARIVFTFACPQADIVFIDRQYTDASGQPPAETVSRTIPPSPGPSEPTDDGGLSLSTATVIALNFCLSFGYCDPLQQINLGIPVR